MLRYIVVTLGSIALVALFEGVRQVLRWMEEKRREELRRRLKAIGEDLGVEGGKSLLRKTKLANSPFLREVLRALPFTASVERLLDQTDTTFTVAQIMGWSLLGACAGALGALILRANIIVALVFMTAAFAAPYVALMIARSRRSAHVSEQLPEALDMVSRSLRAGHALSAAFEIVAKEMPEPVAIEFGRVYESQRLGVAVESALAQMSDRVPGNTDVNMLVVSSTIQRETGGNLAEILSNLAETIRSRYRFHGKLRALTAEGRASAAVIAALPFVVTLGLEITAPKYLTTLVTTPLGRACLAYAAVTWLLGVFWLNKMARVEF